MDMSKWLLIHDTLFQIDKSSHCIVNQVILEYIHLLTVLLCNSSVTVVRVITCALSISYMAVNVAMASSNSSCETAVKMYHTYHWLLVKFSEPYSDIIVSFSQHLTARQSVIT